MSNPAVENRLATLPKKPGVYLFLNSQREVIYVGKANVLRHRVRSYFTARGQTGKVATMVPQIVDIDYIITGSELEALVLECNLIKKHRPRYNVRLRDDKHYPYLKVTVNEEWPRLFIARRIANDGARYFGPYTDSRSVWRTIDLLKKLFPYRSCNKTITGEDKRPCLNYHIRRCLGPCIGAVTHQDYVAVIQRLCLFLEGRHEQIVKEMRQKMEEASDNLEFERAAFLRDQIVAVEKVTERQRIISTAMKDEDVIAFARSNGEACVQVFFIRGGKLVGREHFALEGTHGEDGREIMTSFVTQFYDGATYIPPKILLAHEVDEAATIHAWLKAKRGDKVSLQVPRRGENKKLVEMVAENASEVLEEMRARWLADEMKTGNALLELAEHLQLASPPSRIECYDISNIHGSSAVGAMAVFINGQPKNNEYRRFRIRDVTTINDYAMLQEVLRRRFKRVNYDQATAGSDASWRVLPDLVIIDGGKGHLSAALEVLNELELEGRVPAISLAKQNEEVFSPHLDQSLMLPRTSQTLYLLQRIRDEAHRFALSYHKQVRTRSSLVSRLDDIPGVGPKRKAALLKRFGTLKSIGEASIDDIRAAGLVNAETARRIKEVLE